MKRGLTLVLALLLLLSSVSALANELPLTAEPQTLTVLVQATNKMVDITTNDYTKWLEEQTGVHLDFVTILDSTPESEQALSLMLNSGEKLPDILLGRLSYDQQYLYGQQGILTPLNELIKNNAPNLTKTYQDYPLYAATSTRPDGNIYYVTAYEECYHCTGAQKLWINQKWLDNLGLTMPTTTEEFEQVLLAFKEQDANGNGDPSDEIPMSGIKQTWHFNMEAFLMNSFIYDDGSQSGGYRMAVQDGKLRPAFAQNEWREGLTWMRSMFDKGLIDENAFVQDEATIKALTTGEVPQVGVVPAGHTAIFCTVDSPNIYEYVAVPPLKGPSGVQFAGYFPNVAKTSDGFAVFSGCQNPDLAVKWLDFLFTEEATIRSQYGVQGRDWEYNDDPAVLGLNDEKALFTTFGKNPVFQKTQLSESWEHTAPFKWVDYIFAGQAVLGGDSYDLEKVLYDATKPYEPYFPKEYCMSLSFEGEDAEFVAMNRRPLEDFVDQCVAEFITGTRDIGNDGDWSAYLDELNGMGLEQYVEILQRGYDAQQAAIASLS